MQDVIRNTIEQIGTILLGKEHQIKLALTCLISGGHLLIEDLPGMGKTTLSQTLARELELSFNRIQFTSDLLPADILGVSIYEKERGSFTFHPGPIFNQLILADEINRATPKSQSALLEAMEERQVTIEGKTRILPSPFFVIATQNPNTQAGTFPLPESQLDRFLMRIELGYPDPVAERILLKGEDRRAVLSRLKPAMNSRQLVEAQTLSSEVKVSEALIDYIQRLVQYTRQSPDFAYGLSPRGTLALLNCAKSWALIEDRSHVVPEDVQAVLPAIVEHRLREAADFTGHGGSALAQRLLTKVDVIG
ncbi:MAG: MoxR family ATPase [Pseudomonadales bacterium]|jgi:MoxR-like ATPase|nr:AAA family ATPase [Gammaproteobacteria bacterium]MDP6025153.1 MoxR family ATPase [Pseudomonadales bacterium]MDP6314788.1 MoxR family ATPase [Pseudomonadales bacterium]MDP7575960.1 MoxR family ATPase [Pseudomonadales bacterium]HJP51524.1 MoxR family ATPase [Pseudomonadales bacterium]|tara:strand:- start:2593 stop:3513 length:921 start_codon:yes stop_codon:yes gene_type:complete